MTLRTNSGGDPTHAVIEELQQVGKQVTREAMIEWNTRSQEYLFEAAGQRGGGNDQGLADDSEGRQGRLKHNLQEIAKSFTAPVWDPNAQRWVFGIGHPFADVHEWGAMPHEIEARQAQALAFEWPDAPEEVRERFEETFPTVFLDNVDHPGVPAIGFLRYGRERARQHLQSEGFDVDTFDVRGDDQ